MKIGYARVSTDEQNLQLQIDALGRAGCDSIYTDQGISGSDFSRPGLDTALDSLAAGDSLVVWRLDRLGRSLGKLLDLVTHLENRSIQFESLTEAINTSSSGGLLIFHMMAALAQFERSLISERTRAGMAAARARGKPLGRKPALNDKQREQALRLLKKKSITEVAAHFDVHPRTVKRMLLDDARAKLPTEGEFLHTEQTSAADISD
ncbi:recombinase family protein [Burkholderia ambifaria]|uniref:recombinase family protein n=1 Tax=Burkholderia ambifaria TaxID=152480 RepID=UPI001E3A0DE3|nr:recombinase family protein [Burkholderia ambifaria]UEP23087.1 recombinase family protein [Burkholderia ambifaria]